MNPINHLAIIMDGNGRWGVKFKGSRNAGHRAGLNTVETTIKVCIQKKIKYLTLYAFSTENWKRPKNEINFLFNLLESFLIKKINYLIEKKIGLNFIGELHRLPNSLKKLIKDSEKKTKLNSIIHVNIALNYGSKNELVNAVKKIYKKKLKLNEDNIKDNLFTKNIPDPDLLIRTGNTKRLSNFMLWQLAYSEIFFENKLWPDFKEKDLIKILNIFRDIKRNFGSI